jgi:chromosome segregation ATPase
MFNSADPFVERPEEENLIATLRARIAELERANNEMRLDREDNERTIEQLTRSVMMVKDADISSLKERLALAESERLTDGACEELFRRLDTHSGHSFGLLEAIRAARGAKEQA